MGKKLSEFEYILTLKAIDDICMKDRITMKKFFEEAQKTIDEAWEGKPNALRDSLFTDGKPSVEEFIFRVAVSVHCGTENGAPPY